MDAIRFPEGFRLGVASAATQIDGDCRNSNWYRWYLEGHIKDGSNPDVATHHRDRVEDDTSLMASMGIHDYRFGLEWSRLEPQKGVFCDEEYARVRDELTLLINKGIRPLVTLHHFSNPLWFEDQGGFLTKEGIKDFLEYVDQTIGRIGDLVNEYITINEPNVYALNGYFAGTWPPAKRSFFKMRRVIKNMGICHRKSYIHIHNIRRQMGLTDTRVGFAHHMRVFAPKNPKNPWHRLCNRIVIYYFQDYISKTYTIGPRKYYGVYADFHAINYYSRTSVSGLHDETFENVDCNDLGWEIYPDGIVECAHDMSKIIKLPIYVTENGTCDNHDAFRPRFIYEHLAAISKSDLPFQRYYHWCFVDNFEWLEGMSAHFGLVCFDPATFERTIKKSGEFYKEIIKAGGIDAQIISQYCDCSYHK